MRDIRGLGLMLQMFCEGEGVERIPTRAWPSWTGTNVSSCHFSELNSLSGTGSKMAPL